MVVPVLLVVSVVVCSWSMMFGRTPQTLWMDRVETRWLLALQSTLLLLAYISPNMWVGIATAWIAIHPWVAYIAFKYNYLVMQPCRDSVYLPLWPVVWWSIIYNILARVWHPGDWRIVAYGLIL